MHVVFAQVLAAVFLAGALVDLCAILVEIHEEHPYEICLLGLKLFLSANILDMDGKLAVPSTSSLGHPFSGGSRVRQRDKKDG